MLHFCLSPLTYSAKLSQWFSTDLEWLTTLRSLVFSIVIARVFGFVSIVIDTEARPSDCSPNGASSTQWENLVFPVSCMNYFTRREGNRVSLIPHWHCCSCSCSPSCQTAALVVRFHKGSWSCLLFPQCVHRGQAELGLPVLLLCSCHPLYHSCLWWVSPSSFPCFLTFC